MNTCLHCDGSPEPGEDLCPPHLAREMAAPRCPVSPVPPQWRHGYVRPAEQRAKRRNAA